MATAEAVTTVVECDLYSIVWDVDAKPPPRCPNCGKDWSRTRVEIGRD